MGSRKIKNSHIIYVFSYLNVNLTNGAYKFRAEILITWAFICVMTYCTTYSPNSDKKIHNYKLSTVVYYKSFTALHHPINLLTTS